MPFHASGHDLYHIHTLSERELLKTYETLLRDACHHSDVFWQEWHVEPGAGLWGSGRSDNMNEGIRAISEMVLTCGVLLQYSDVFTPAERDEYARKSVAAVRYAVSTHLTGPQPCTDDKHWGGTWQSAMWTGTLGFGAWMIWDRLDPDLRKGVERVVASESDRFLEVRPPGMTKGDTKAEENGWNLICLALAANMFRNNAHAPAWEQQALEYAMNTLSAPQDKDDNTVVDGRPVKEWFVGHNLYPDFTLENHNFFHPSYVACSCYFMTQTALIYTYAHRPVPQAATHHLMDTWRMFQHILLPSGEPAFPQGMDWELHGLPVLNLYASLNAREHQPLAARMEQVSLQYMRAWQLMKHGDLAVPGSKLDFTRHAICAEQAAYGLLAHKLFGPDTRAVSVKQAAKSREAVESWNWVATILHRTANKFVSMSWTNRVMGMLIPIGPGHEGNPFFTVPIRDGFIGSFTLAPDQSREQSRDRLPRRSVAEAGDGASGAATAHGTASVQRGGRAGAPPRNSELTVLDRSWKQTENGFETSGTLLLNGGQLKQTLKVTSIGEQTTVYEDRVTALSEVTVLQEQGLPLGIENDEITGGTRALSWEHGKATVGWCSPARSIAIPGPWANVDGRLGIVVVKGSGMSYRKASGYAPGISVCADVLRSSFSEQSRHFKPGEQVARRVAVLYTEITCAKTSKLARMLKLDPGLKQEVLHVRLPEGGEAKLILQ